VILHATLILSLLELQCTHLDFQLRERLFSQKNTNVSLDLLGCGKFLLYYIERQSPTNICYVAHNTLLINSNLFFVQKRNVTHQFLIYFLSISLANTSFKYSMANLLASYTDMDKR
jgi:hypothetical protein